MNTDKQPSKNPINTTSKIPQVRLTRTQKLARLEREKKEQQQIANTTHNHNPKSSHTKPPSRKPTPHPTTKYSHTSRTKPSNISNTLHKTHESSSLASLSSLCSSRVSTKEKPVASLDTTTQPTPSTPLKPSLRSTRMLSDLPREHVSNMMEDLGILFSMAHYNKVEHEYIRRDSIRTAHAKNSIFIPIPTEENRPHWIETQLIQYPITMADMIARGAFIPSLESSFPSVELFRKTYMDPKNPACYVSRPPPNHIHISLWKACGSPFPYTKWPLVDWNKVNLIYEPSRIHRATELCMKGNPAWFFAFWGNYGTELKRFGYEKDYDPSVNPYP